MAESDQQPTNTDSLGRKALKAAPVIIVGSVMFSFISYWRVAAVVLCDLASTAFYIGGIVEQAIGPAAPWYIMGVMAFSYCVRAVYIESCSLFVRGGVYRVVKEALGGMPAKAAVSALLFDYILTGPISAVSAGQYLIGWIIEFIAVANPSLAITNEALRGDIKHYGSMLFAIAITLYFFRQNLIGIHESSGKALKIMGFTTVVAVIVLGWCGITLALRGPVNSVPIIPDLKPKFVMAVENGTDRLTGEEREVWKRDADTGKLIPELDEAGNPVEKINKLTGRQEDPLGFMHVVFPSLTEKLRDLDSSMSWKQLIDRGLVLIGVLGLMLAFGHSILAMSGEETMAQVYREVESPKLPNFQKAAFVIFTYSLILTAGVSFLAILIIPDEVRMKDYADNLLGGLAMHVVGPAWIRVALNALVVAAGFLILSGAVNTSIIGSNGVLNRVAEDGVLPDQLQKPHAKYGTTHRILYLIVGLQLFTIIASGGDMVLLGEAYAFGVIWSFFFNALSMLVLRFKDKRIREFKVPFNVHIGGYEIPCGILFVFCVLGSTALLNLFTKEVATIGGLSFSCILMGVFLVTERFTHQQNKGNTHEHIEQFTERSSVEVSAQSVGSTKLYRKLVAIRSPQNLYMLQRAMEETDPESTDILVMTAKNIPQGADLPNSGELDRYDRKLMTAVIELAEKSGKHITPMVVPTNNPLFAVMNTAKSLGIQELVVGASNKFTAEEQLDQMVFYWININGGVPTPLTIRVLSKTWDFYYDVGGGNRIPRISERQARSVAELRAAGVGVRRVLMHHDNTHRSRDLFDSVLTMLDPDVVFDLVHLADVAPVEAQAASGSLTAISTGLAQDVERAQKIGREVTVHEISGDPGPAIVALALEHDYDLIVLDSPAIMEDGASLPAWEQYVREHASCAVCLLSLPVIQREVVDKTPSGVLSVSSSSAAANGANGD
jgi:amino acid transporter/nucleotide-binding universal stress UspA family protein